MEEDVHEYEGRALTVSYDATRCIHVRGCVEGLPAVFDADRRPWVDPDAAGADAVAEVVERCPTGALQYERADGRGEATPPVNTVTATSDGPLYVRGDVTVRAGETVLADTRVGLCRCGHSGNKPLCDNSHARVFDAAGAGETPDPTAPPDAEERPDEPADGPLTVTATRNGPFRLEGQFLLRTVDGVEHRESAALCRCGSSGNKPFCDGTHAEVGFTTAEGE